MYGLARAEMTQAAHIKRNALHFLAGTDWLFTY